MYGKIKSASSGGSSEVHGIRGRTLYHNQAVNQAVRPGIIQVNSHNNTQTRAGKTKVQYQQRSRYRKSYKYPRGGKQTIHSKVNSINLEVKWSKVTVSYGMKYSKNVIIDLLTNASKVPFIPIKYHPVGRNTAFFVEGALAASELVSLSGQITSPLGFKLVLTVDNGRQPHPDVIDLKLENQLKSAINKRYDTAFKTLDLSKFYCAKEICTENYAPLSSGEILHVVIKAIAESFPDVNAIDLSSNALSCLKQIKALSGINANLTTLNLADNQIANIDSLNCLEGLSIRNLSIKQNPLERNFKNRETFVSVLRKRLPRLMCLDGVELPPMRSSDAEFHDIPPAQPSWCDDINAAVLRFFELYVSVYDSENRERLRDAYHDTAVLTITQPTSGEGLSRDGQSVLVRNGKTDIVSALTNLPNTTHDCSSVTVDVQVASNTLINVSLTGIYKETMGRQETVRCFQRLFDIIPNANGFCIKNERFCIANPGGEQAAKAFKAVPEKTETSQEELRTPMIHSFSEQSGMTLEWSARCLEENDWDFDRAAYAFGQLKSQIPPLAFIKHCP